MENSLNKTKILFFCETVTLAHVIRPLSLMQNLDLSDYEVHVASTSQAQVFFKNQNCEFHTITCLSAEAFRKALADGSTFIDGMVLEKQINEDLALIEKIKPALVVGDFHLSLNISARVAQVPYMTLTNLHWATFQPKDLPTPDIPPLRAMGYPMARFLFKNVISHFLPLIMNSQAKEFNRLRRQYSLPPYALLTDSYIDGDIVGLCDIPPETLDKSLPSNCIFLGPICGDSTKDQPSWFNQLSTSKKKIYINLGSSGDHAIVESLLRELTTLDIEIVVGSPNSHIENLKVQFPHVFYGSNLPGSALCQWADVIIFNGGSPSGHQALLEGKPVIAITTNPDQVLNMKKLESYSFVRHYRNWNLNAEQVKSDVNFLLNSHSTQKEAQQYASKLKSFKSLSWSEIIHRKYVV